MNFFDELSALTNEAIATFGKGAGGAKMTLVYEGVEIDCYQEDSEAMRQLMDGGALEGVDMIVRARVADFPAQPKGLQLLTIDGVPRKIVKTLGSFGDPEIRLDLQTIKQRGK